MTKFIKIESKGTIDTQAFYLLGASSKREDNTKIGFFGSGLKYSIAYLLRNDIEFKVFSDYKEIKFSTEKVDFRGQEFKVIKVDDKDTSMTTEMGIDWEPWFVIREIYCNAIDEGESKISIVKQKVSDIDKCIPIEDKTVFYIKITNEFQELVDNWSNFFSEKRKDILYSDDKGNKIFNASEGLIAYRKGIRCLYIKEEKTLFHYDMSWITINESRIIKSDWDFKYSLVKFLKVIECKKVIAHILNCINEKWEKSLYWDNFENFSFTWLEVIGNKTLVPYENCGFWQELMQDAPEQYLILPSTLVSGLKKTFTNDIRVIGDVNGKGNSVDFKQLKELNKKQNFLLDECLNFLNKSGYKINYPIIVGDFLSTKTLGQAKDDTILLSVKVFELGRKEIVSTIYEENEHLISKCSDETREFQNHLIMNTISLMEEKTNIYL
jgi:hypothetical protein